MSLEFISVRPSSNLSDMCSAAPRGTKYLFSRFVRVSNLFDKRHMSFLPLFYWWTVSLHITCRFFWSVTFRQFVLTRVSNSRDERSHHFVLRAWSRNRCYTFPWILFSFYGSCHSLKVNERENLRDVCLLTNLMISCEAVNFHLRASRTKAEIIEDSASIGLPIIPQVRCSEGQK